MSRLLISVSALAFFALQPAFAKPFASGCNPAIQNWENGSKDTCAYPSGNGGVIAERTPVVVETIPEVDEEVPEETVD
jgi:hypothetical protein